MITPHGESASLAFVVIASGALWGEICMQRLHGDTTQQPSDDIMVIREREVAERIRAMSGTFTIRQMASIHRMSIPYLREFAKRYGICFVNNEGNRSKRLSSAIIARERVHTTTIVARSLVRKPVTTLDSDKITPELRERARRRDLESANSFVEMLRELSKSHTREEAAKIAGISPTFMRRMAYDHDIAFVGEVVVDTPTTPAHIKKLRSTMFRPTRAVPMATSRLIRNFVISDTEDEV